MAALPVLAQQDSPQTLDAMRAEIAALQTEMQQMRSERDRSWIDERQKEEVKALIEEVLADAETRGSFQNEAGTLAGWDRGFYLASADDTFRLDIGGLLQFQYLISSADDPPTGDDVERGFVIHRGRLKFSGHVGNPDLNYFIQLESNRSVGDLFLLDAPHHLPIHRNDRPPRRTVRRTAATRATSRRAQLARGGSVLCPTRSSPPTASRA